MIILIIIFCHGILQQFYAPLISTIHPAGTSNFSYFSSSFHYLQQYWMKLLCVTVSICPLLPAAYHPDIPHSLLSCVRAHAHTHNTTQTSVFPLRARDRILEASESSFCMKQEESPFNGQTPANIPPVQQRKHQLQRSHHKAPAAIRSYRAES